MTDKQEKTKKHKMSKKQKTALKVFIGTVLTALATFIASCFLDSCATISASVEKAQLDVQPIHKSSID